MKAFYAAITILCFIIQSLPAESQHILNNLQPVREFTATGSFGLESAPQGIAFNNTGTRMFVTGAFVEEVWFYNLSIPFDVSTASYGGKMQVDVDPLFTDPQALLFTPDGTRLVVSGDFGSNRMWQFDLTNPFDVTSVDSSDDLVMVSEVRDMAWSPDGMSIYLLRNARIVTFDMTVPYDITTATFVPNEDIFLNHIAPNIETARGFSFDEIGTELLVVDENRDSIVKYSLSSPYHIASTTYAGASEEFFVGDKESSPTEVLYEFSDNKLFVLGSGSGDVHEYTLNNHISFTENLVSAVVDIDAQSQQGPVATYPIDQDVSYALSGEDAADFTIDADGVIHFVNPPDFELPHDSDLDNSYVFNLIVTNDLTGDQEIRVFVIDVEDNAETPYFGPFAGGFELATATYSGSTSSYYVGDILGNARDLVFSETGRQLFILDNLVDSIYQFDLASPYQLPSASYSGIRLYVGDALTEPSGFTITPDGSKLIISGESSVDKKIYEYQLSTPHDLSTAIYAGEAESLDASGSSFSGGGIGTVRFSDDGMILYVMRLAFLFIEEYPLAAPYDISTGVKSNIWVQGTEFDFEPTDVAFSDDGLLFWKLADGNSWMIRYVLTSPFDLTTLDYVGPSSSSNNDQIFRLTDPEANPISFAFNSGGTKFYLLGTTDDRIYEYHLPATIEVGENESFVFDVDAWAGGGGAVDTGITFELSGTDASYFAISSSGIITFLTPPDFENPQDAGANNRYEITVKIDNGGDFDTQDLVIEVVDKQDEVPPVITTGTSFTIEENINEILFFASATDANPITFSLGTSKDESFFNLVDGEFLPVGSFDFENPQDANGDNAYIIDLIASDADNDVIQEVTITVTDMAETFAKACESYDWEGNTYSASGTYLNTFVGSMGQDSIAALHLTINQPNAGSATVEACESYDWEGSTYTTSGDYSVTLTNAVGCDSVATLNLTILEATAGSATVEACESYEWEGSTYTASGDYTAILTNAAGCDSTATLNLTILEATTSSEEVSACESYDWNGTTYTESGTYSAMFTNSVGCDSTATLDLTILEATAGNETVAACESYEWEGTTYTTSGDYVVTLTNAVGCDSTATLNLTILDATSGSSSVEACESYEWEGSTYTTSGDYSVTLTNAVGCDSVATLNLTILEATSGSATVEACESYEWEGGTYTASGDYTATLTNAAGCDSTATLNLTILEATFSSEEVSACESYGWNGSTYTESGTYSAMFTNSVGCDSTATLELTILEATSGNETVAACESYEWEGTTYTTSGDYVVTLTNAAGCDSTATLNLTILEATSGSSSVEACESYEWEGSTYTASGDYSVTFTNAVGCDSVATLNLTILEATSGSAAVEACESYEWEGMTYTVSGDYTATLTNTAGCDSTATLNLTILEATSSSEEVSACESYDWNGTTYTESGTYSAMFTNSVGCDSVATLALTILEATSSSEEVSSCESYEWNGTTYIESGTYTHMFTNAAGCDSTATLVLEILEATSGASEVSSCESYEWEGTTYTVSGSYTALLTSAAGCDSTATLDLTILESTSSEEEVQACASYEWNEVTYTASGTYTEAFTNAAGCDSTATLVLEIFEEVPETVIVTNNGGTLTAEVDDQVYTVQWLNCDGDLVVEGATASEFVPEASGSYAVRVTNGECEVVSSCIDIEEEVLSVRSSIEISVFPNPATGPVTLQFDKVMQEVQVSVYQVSGRLVKSVSAAKASEMNIELKEAGIYLLHVEEKGRPVEVFKVIKE